MNITRPELQARLEEAGAILLMLPGRVMPAGVKSNMPEVVHDVMEALADTAASPALPRPTAAQISRMDEALRWVSLIPETRNSPGAQFGGCVLRRIVHARLLVDPLSWLDAPDYPLYIVTWRSMARIFKADRRSIKVWHASALGLICNSLNTREPF